MIRFIKIEVKSLMKSLGKVNFLSLGAISVI